MDDNGSHGSSNNHFWGPATEESEIIRTMCEIGAAFDLRLPVLSLERGAQLMSLEPHRRHQIEKPVIRRTLAQFFGNDHSFDSSNVDIKWLATGKPSFVETQFSDLGLS